MRAVVMMRPAVRVAAVELPVIAVVPVRAAAAGPTGCSVVVLLLMLLVRSRWVRQGWMGHLIPPRWVLVMMMLRRERWQMAGLPRQ